MIITWIAITVFIILIVFLKEDIRPTQDTPHCAAIRAQVKQLIAKE